MQKIDRSVISLRVIALDTETTSAANDIRDSVFGIDRKEFTMESQFKNCSHGNFKPASFSGTTTTSINVNNGVMYVNIDTNYIWGWTWDTVDDVYYKQRKF